MQVLVTLSQEEENVWDRGCINLKISVLRDRSIPVGHFQLVPD